MIGVLVNTLAVIAGSSVGLLFRRGIPEKISKAVMTAIGLCTLYLGISGALVGQNAIIVILALVLGTGLGTALDIDGSISRLGRWVESRFRQPVAGGASIGEGFVTASLLFCIGSMTIVGSLNAGLSGDNTMLFAKSVLDLISSTMLAVSLGLGVLLGVFNVYFRDIGHLVGIVFQFLFWLTPIVYPLNMLPPWAQTVIRLNPLTILVEHYQSVILYARLPTAEAFQGLAWVALLACICVFLGYKIHRDLGGEMADEL